MVGPGAEAVGRALARAARRHRVAAALAPSAPDVSHLVRSLPIPILAQHADPLDAGATTGFVPPETLAACGARGSLVNHSEHRLSAAAVADSVGRLGGLGLVAVVCARDAAEAGRLARTRPPYLAVEPPELIGGQRSVSTARPGVVRASVLAVRRVAPRTRVLCGAGIHDRSDVRKALELGAEGVLVASAVTRAKDPSAAIDELLRGFPRAP